MYNNNNNDDNNNNETSNITIYDMELMKSNVCQEKL